MATTFTLAPIVPAMMFDKNGAPNFIKFEWSLFGLGAALGDTIQTPDFNVARLWAGDGSLLPTPREIFVTHRTAVSAGDQLKIVDGNGMMIGGAFGNLTAPSTITSYAFAPVQSTSTGTARAIMAPIVDEILKVTILLVVAPTVAATDRIKVAFRF